MRKWFVQGGICLVFAFALAGTVSANDRPSVPPVEFDLSNIKEAERPNNSRKNRDKPTLASLTLEEPASAPTRFKAPAAEMPIGKKGATVGVGALGSRHRGVPKLAHIVLDWDF